MGGGRRKCGRREGRRTEGRGRAGWREVARGQRGEDLLGNEFSFVLASLSNFP